eukprot:6329796-Amphidinium_carterae.2
MCPQKGYCIDPEELRNIPLQTLGRVVNRAVASVMLLEPSWEPNISLAELVITTCAWNTQIQRDLCRSHFADVAQGLDVAHVETRSSRPRE